jgi:hypothetical protein
MKSLYVGDPHVTATELEDARGLLAAIKACAAREQPENVVFLGDQYHNHSILHVEVVDFWIKGFRELSDLGYDIVALVGNHDLPGNGSLDKHAMQIHKDIVGNDAYIHVEVVDEPLDMGGILYLPYYASGEDFLAACRAHPQAKTVVCHQGFTGATYDNGFKVKGTDFYTEGGIDPNLVPQEAIISGHIHAPQEFDKVWYVGAPRWRTLSDANTDRHLWVVEHAQDGSILSKKSFSMEGYCRPIFAVVETPETEQQDPKTFFAANDSADLRVDLRGPSAWVETRKIFWAEVGAKVRTFKTDTALVKVKESEGISTAFSGFFEKFQPRFGTSKDILRKLVEERLSGV